MRSEYTDKIVDYVGNRLVKVLIGQRRSGKSYILRQILQRLVDNGVKPENTLFINREFADYDFLRTHKDLDELMKLDCRYETELNTYRRGDCMRCCDITYSVIVPVQNSKSLSTLLSLTIIR